MSAITVLEDILKLLAADTTTSAYFVREGMDGPVTEAMIEQGLVEVGFDPASVQEDDDYQGSGCVRCRLHYIIRVTRRHTNLNTARRLVIRTALDVMNALQATTEAAGSEMVRIQSPIFGALQLGSVRSPELASDCNAVGGYLTYSCLEYQVPGSR